MPSTGYPPQVDDTSFATAQAWTVRENAKPFDFTAWSSRCNERHRPTTVLSPVRRDRAVAGAGSFVGVRRGVQFRLQRAILHVVAGRIEARLLSGERTTWALTLDLGVDKLLADLRTAELLPMPSDDAEAQRQRDNVKTARAALADPKRGTLVQVGQLASHMRNGRLLDGANVYFVPLQVVVDGKLESAVVVGNPEIRSPNRAIGRRAPSLPESEMPECARGYGLRARRARAALRRAVLEVQVGTRNTWANWLAWTAAKSIGLSRADVDALLTAFQRSVPGRGSFTLREVQATVASVFRRLARASEPSARRTARKPAARPLATSDVILGPPRRGPSRRAQRRAEWDRRHRVPEANRIFVADLTIDGVDLLLIAA